VEKQVFRIAKLPSPEGLVENVRFLRDVRGWSSNDSQMTANPIVFRSFLKLGVTRLSASVAFYRTTAFMLCYFQDFVCETMTVRIQVEESKVEGHIELYLASFGIHY
jgi:hypothetical protein